MIYFVMSLSNSSHKAVMVLYNHDDRMLHTVGLNESNAASQPNTSNHSTTGTLNISPGQLNVITKGGTVAASGRKTPQILSNSSHKAVMVLYNHDDRMLHTYYI
jgi:phage head maturation protease